MVGKIGKAGLFFPLFALGLLGCAAVDQYSSRAISYNLEAEAALDQGLLLNIVRAAHRWPMQFTSIGTITGTATASGTASLASLLGPHPSTTAPPKLATLGGTVSGGPTFGIPVLDTQEF